MQSLILEKDNSMFRRQIYMIPGLESIKENKNLLKSKNNVLIR